MAGNVMTHGRLPLAMAALAIVLALPSLRAGLVFDDYHHKLLMQGCDHIVRLLDSPFDMFRLIDGDPRHTAALMDYGLFPWWTYEGIQGAFWRPLASLTHWLDYVLWPKTPALMHAQSIAWYALLAASVTVLYRRFLGVTVTAGLAALLYCIDDAHGDPIGFLANRNALLSAVFGVWCLLAYERWRRTGWRAGAVLGPVLLAMSLLSKEEGIATCGYLAAFAVFLDASPWRRRVAALLPYAVLVVVWRLAWSQLGYGVAHIGGYIDPLTEPARFALRLASQAPLALLGQLAAPPSELYILVGATARAWLFAGACVFLVLTAAAAWPLLRANRVARFWATGMLLATVPIVATFPSDRMLLFVGLGAMGLVAQFLAFVFTGTAARAGRWSWRSAVVGLGVVLVALHMVVAPLALPVRASMVVPRWLIDRLRVVGPMEPAVTQQDLVVVNPPSMFMLIASPLMWASEGAPMPGHLRVLTSSLLRPVDIRRTDERTLVIRPETGFITSKPDQLCRDERNPFALGEQVRLTGMTVTITELAENGWPAEAAFQFAVPLEDASLRWLQFRDGAFVPFKPPPVGHSVILPGSWRDLLPAPAAK